MHFFAAESDMLLLIREATHLKQLNAIATGKAKKNLKDDVINLSNIPNLGNSPYSDSALNPSYLVWETKNEIKSREVPQRKGGAINLVDQRDNPETIVIRPGGAHPDGIISGEISTIHASTESLELYKLFEKLIKQRFTKIKSYYVGNDAIKALSRGERLTSSTSAPTEYDLTID